ncbi:alpha/beta fold hydrolase [Pendulispora brunnea]|uniref:Alpha/beta fold hydrolase n=1 Tax=Pendulispora brunnea TaxID=2905690 RepID=A0ABZ2KG41_9BACT
MHLFPNRREWAEAGSNVRERLFRGHIADLRPQQPGAILAEGPQRTVWRYHRTAPARGRPVLLVPPLAAPALCFDLRRGCSVAEHMIASGRPTYLVDYGAISFGDRHLGLEHWVRDVLPEAVRSVSADAGGEPVQLVGWCLGGIMSVVMAAEHSELPIASIALVASPFDFSQVPLIAPLRPLFEMTDGAIGRVFYRTFGGAPARLVQAAYQFAGLEKYLTKPLAIVRNLDDREFLAQIEAVDRFMSNMLAYPGRTFGQLYHHILGANALAEGRMTLAGQTIDIRSVLVPLLNIAGEGDGIAPKAAVHHLGRLIPSTQLETCPGGHLGVLTGRAARHTTWAVIDAFLDRTK